MKLLLDENLSRRLVPFLQHDYPGSSQVVLLGLESASDSVVWQTARDHDFVIVTRDADFEELSLVWGQASHYFLSLKTVNGAVSTWPPISTRSHGFALNSRMHSRVPL